MAFIPPRATVLCIDEFECDTEQTSFVTQHHAIEAGVELTVKSSPGAIERNSKCNVCRMALTLFVTCSVDLVIFCCMLNIYVQAVDAKFIGIANPSYLAISGFCLLSTIFLVISAINLYCPFTMKSRSAICAYFAAVIFHSVLFWCEHIAVSDISSRCVHASCMPIERSIMVIKYALMWKGIIFSAAFLLGFVYNLYASVHRQRYMISILLLLCGTFLLSLLLSVGTAYYHHASLIHTISAFFGLIHAKLRLCCTEHSSTAPKHHWTTTTYVENANDEDEDCDWLIPGGLCCQHGSKGCCEWNCEGGGFCVFCGAGCGSYPDSTCFSCCGICTCFCCDAGGCYGACCWSYDFFTWCGCGCC